MAITALTELNPADWSTFLDRHLATHQPVVLRKAAADWPAISRWSSGYLKQAVRGMNVVVKSKSDYGPAGSQRHIETVAEVAFPVAIDMMDAEDAPDMSYVRQTATLADVPSLLADIGTLHERLEISPAHGNLWIGPTGTLAQMHWDPHCNLMAQIRGKKRWILVAPEQSALTYPNRFSLAQVQRFCTEAGEPTGLAARLGEWLGRSVSTRELIQRQLCARDKEFIFGLLAAVNNCDLDAERPDNERTPLFATATRLEAVVEAGDMIYVPSCWRHCVRSLSPSVSVNWFFHDDRMAPGLIDRTLLEHLSDPLS